MSKGKSFAWKYSSRYTWPRRFRNLEVTTDVGFHVLGIWQYVPPSVGREWSGDVDLETFVATVQFWQEKGWLGPLPKRVPKVFRDALEGVE